MQNTVCLKQNIYFTHPLHTKVTDYMYVACSFANSFTHGPNTDAVEGGNRVFK